MMAFFVVRIAFAFDFARSLKYAFFSAIELTGHRKGDKKP
jgi:hypothetical protein